MSKKLVTLLLTLTLVLSAGAPAFAGTSETGQTTAKSTVSADASSGSTASQAGDPAADTQSPDTDMGESPASTVPDPSDSDGPTDADDDSAVTEGAAGNPAETDTLTEAEKAEAEKAAAEAAEKEKEKEKAEAAKKAAEKKAEKYRNGLASYMRSKNPALSKSWSRTLADYFIASGKKYDVDPRILMAIAQRESTFRASATSPYGIKGMMQTSDALARQYGYKPSSLYKAKVSIDVGARYLGAAKKKFGTYTKALSAYVYGSYAVSKGKYSKAQANAMLKIRRDINAYLEKYDFV